ncbi:hypothetical protein HSX11_25460 [Oxalobacteraceae bacterium]|nr:hypothetical protein [Oxalobacteraceae bacterium]
MAVAGNAAIAAPARPTVLAFDSQTPPSGTLVNVAWSKWWGDSGERWELLHNGSLVCEGKLALDPAKDPRQQQDAACPAYLAPGANLFVARLCDRDACSDSAAVSLQATSIERKANLNTWDQNAVYGKGDQVLFDGAVVQANYWVQHTSPLDREAWTPVANAAVDLSAQRTTDWQYGADAAYSIVFDDYCGWANDEGQKLAESELSKRGLVASWGVMAGSCGDPAWSSHWSVLKGFVQRGHEVFNHSWDHGHPMAADWASNKWGGNDLEIRQSSEKVSAMLDGYKMQFFGFPFDVATEEQLNYLKAMPQYLGTRTPNYWQADGVNETAFADPFRLRFQVYMQAQQDSADPASLHNYLSRSVTARGWGMRVFHSVQDGYYESAPLEQFQQHLDEVQAKVADGKVWVGTTSEVLKYRYAREACVLQPAQVVSAGVLLGFDNISDSCARYVTSLTVELALAGSGVKAMQAGRPLALTAVGNGKYRMQVEPRGGRVLLY